MKVAIGLVFALIVAIGASARNRTNVNSQDAPEKEKEYRSVDQKTLSGSCGATYTSPGSATSPGFQADGSGEYENDMRCVYSIFAPSDQVTRLTFDSFDTETGSPCYDSVLIGTDGELIGPFCGNQTGYTITGRSLSIIFETDSSVKRNGFSMSWTFDEATSGCVECGIPQVPTMSTLDTEKIVGGVDATEHGHPWAVSVTNRVWTNPYSPSGFGHWCGGSVVSPIHILTAAHCVDNGLAMDFRVVIGEHDQTVDNDDAQEMYVKKVFVHELYGSGGALDYDIAILELTEPIIYSASVQPVCLSTSDPDVGDDVVVVGWGETETGDLTWTILQEVWVPMLDPSTCYTGLPADQICAGQTGYDSCQGDSGGPLTKEVMKDGTLTYEQAGIVSWGIGCADAGNPGVYASVAYYRDWIDNIIE